MNMQTLRVPLLILCFFSALIVLFVKPRVHGNPDHQKQAATVKVTATE